MEDHMGHFRAMEVAYKTIPIFHCPKLTFKVLSKRQCPINVQTTRVSFLSSPPPPDTHTRKHSSSKDNQKQYNLSVVLKM